VVSRLVLLALGLVGVVNLGLVGLLVADAISEYIKMQTHKETGRHDLHIGFESASDRRTVGVD
jgi:hypothetical protein